MVVLSPCGQTSQERATFVSIPDSEEEFHAPVRRRRTVAAAALGATALVVLVSAATQDCGERGCFGGLSGLSSLRAHADEAGDADGTTWLVGPCAGGEGCQDDIGPYIKNDDDPSAADDTKMTAMTATELAAEDKPGGDVRDTYSTPVSGNSRSSSRSASASRMTRASITRARTTSASLASACRWADSRRRLSRR